MRLSGGGGIGLTRELGIYEAGLWMCAAVCRSSVPGDLKELAAYCSAAEDLFLHTQSSSPLSRGFVVRRWEQVHLPAKPSEGDTSFLVVTPPHVSDDCAAEESKGFSRKQDQGLPASSLHFTHLYLM